MGFIKNSALYCLDHIVTSVNNCNFTFPQKGNYILIESFHNDYVFLKINDQQHVILPNGKLKITDCIGLQNVEFLTYNATISVTLFD